MAAVPFYGTQPSDDVVNEIHADLLLHFAEFDNRVNEGWPDYEKALKLNGKKYTAHLYQGVNHGFHNDTTPRYDKNSAELAWSRTIDFFKNKLN
jgi:carboxymethylenebutenolidase